jgi:DNA end-binding protein Ku
MPRPIWSGSISFGLVNVPVRLFSATSQHDVRFHQLHDKDGVRIKQKRVCPADEEEVAYENIVKGYEIGDGEYVRIEPSELEDLDPKMTRMVDIEEFVDLVDIDPIYFEHTYYLAPSDNAEKPYALLCRSMQEAGKVAIGKFVMRTKEYLCAIRASENVLVLETMLFDDEVVPPKDVDIPEVDLDQVSKKEITMAEQLIESLSAQFEPSKYKDDYREKILELIDKKIAGEEIIVQPTVEPVAPVVDLMAALEQSLQEAKQKKKRATA